MADTALSDLPEQLTPVETDLMETSDLGSPNVSKKMQFATFRDSSMMAAGEAQVGMAEIATTAETTTGTADNKIITPSKLNAEIERRMPTSWIGGLITSRASVSTVTIAAGGCRDSNDSKDIVLSSALTKSLASNWAVGTGNGGLDTGAEANSTLYAIWLIRRSDTGVVDAVFSTSFSSPTLTAGDLVNYDSERLIGAIYNDSAGDIEDYVQYGNYFRYKGRVQESTGWSLVAQVASLTAITVTACPPQCKAKVAVEFRGTGGLSNAWGFGIFDGDSTETPGTYLGYQHHTEPTNGTYGAAKAWAYTNSSKQVKVAGRGGAGSTVDLNHATVGFEMTTRRWV
jgi:hypothetical protein